MSDRVFIDTNLWVYLFSKSDSEEDTKKKSIVVNLLKRSNEITVSTQVLSEMSNVLLNKMGFPVEKVRDIVFEMRESIEIESLNESNVTYALDIIEHYQLSWFDALITASAISSGACVLYSEDMHHGLEIDKSIRIENPFL